MINFFGRLFNTPAAMEKAVDGVVNSLDKVVYTDEEKAEDAANARREASKVIIQWMAASSGQNLTRRFLALVITLVWLLQYVGAQVIDICAVFVDNPQHIDKLAEVSDLLGDRAVAMNGAMMLILGFYFAAPHLSEIVPAAISKFSKQGERRDEAA